MDITIDLCLLQKSIIFAFVLIAAVSCDVSHLDSGDGWHKDESGYHYDQPEAKFDIPEEPIVEEVAVEVEAPVVVEDEIVEVADEVVPPVDYLPPTNELRNNEYLPPKAEEAKRKRQVPVRKVRKVYRRFVRRQ